MTALPTVTRQTIADDVHHALGLSRADSALLVDAVFEEITRSLIKGENVKISGFGSFVLREKNERLGRNPKTGVEVAISPRRVVTFKPSVLLSEQITKNQAPKAAETYGTRSDAA